MSRTPMPSPNGTNHARIYLTGAAYDAAIPNPIDREGGPYPRLPYGRDDADLQKMVETLMNFLVDKLSDSDLAAVKGIFGGDDGTMKIPPELGSDSRVMGRLHRAIAQGRRDMRNPPRLAADVARFDEMFPHAARLK